MSGGKDTDSRISIRKVCDTGSGCYRFVTLCHWFVPCYLMIPYYNKYISYTLEDSE